MSQITDFYISWLGNAAFGNGPGRLKEIEPLVFKPTDLSDCAMWLDENDNFAVSTNQLLQVVSWANKGTLGGQFDLSGAAPVTYQSASVNGLNVVSFSEGNLRFSADRIFTYLFVTYTNILTS